jgi:putative transposase
MCDYFGVSKSGFYSWKKRAKSKKIDRDNTLLREIKRVHRGQRKSYGSPRVYRALRKKGVVCSRRRVARLMQVNDIKASVVGLYNIRPNKHDIYQQADNVLGSVDKSTRPNQQWVADFTYLKTGQA